MLGPFLDCVCRCAQYDSTRCLPKSGAGQRPRHSRRGRQRYTLSSATFVPSQIALLRLTAASCFMLLLMPELSTVFLRRLSALARLSFCSTLILTSTLFAQQQPAQPSSQQTSSQQSKQPASSSKSAAAKQGAQNPKPPNAPVTNGASQYPNLPSEMPDKFTPVTDSFDFVRRDVMIPMRDGVKLHTVIMV